MPSTAAAGGRRASGLAAFVSIVWTLLMSTVVFVAFLLLPIVVLGLAFGVYWFWPGARPKKSKTPKPDDTDTNDAELDLPAYRFGTGG